MERDGDECGRDRREQGAPTVADEGADADDQAGVDEGDEDRERAIHNRLVDHDVDLVEPVLEHGDRDRREKEYERQALEGVDECGGP